MKFEKPTIQKPEEVAPETPAESSEVESVPDDLEKEIESSIESAMSILETLKEELQSGEMRPGNTMNFNRNLDKISSLIKNMKKKTMEKELGRPLTEDEKANFDSY